MAYMQEIGNVSKNPMLYVGSIHIYNQMYALAVVSLYITYNYRLIALIYVYGDKYDGRNRIRYIH